MLDRPEESPVNEEHTQRIRVHIDGHPLSLVSPISGEDLYAAAHVEGEAVLYREVVGNAEDVFVERGATGIVLTEDEHFYSAERHKTEHTILVNARRKTVNGRKVRFEQIVKLAFPEGEISTQTVYTVAYSNGPPRNPEGMMVAGQSVRVCDGMVFDVTETSRS